MPDAARRPLLIVLLLEGDLKVRNTCPRVLVQAVEAVMGPVEGHHENDGQRIHHPVEGSKFVVAAERG